MSSRRSFLRASIVLSGAAAITGGPAWLRRAFAAGRACGPDDTADLGVVSAAYRRAQRAGRPLLCLVVPEDDGAKWTRGSAFGELLNHGSDEDLAPLALCEVVCARMAPLRRLVPAAGRGEPLMVLVDTSAVPAAGLRLDAALPKDEPDARYRLMADGEPRSYKDAMAEAQRREEEVIRRRIGTLARLVREAVAPDGRALGERAAQLRGARGERRRELVASLAGEARARLCKERIPGSRWARQSGCGTDIEGEQDNLVVGCGMGHVPEKSQRFLYFFSKTPAERFRARDQGEPCDAIF